MTAGILATVAAGVIIAQARNVGHAPVATGAELEIAARRVLEATGGEWASIGPSSGSGTWEATVVRSDLSKVSVTLNDKFQILRVTSESEARRRDPRTYASVPDPAAGPVYMLAQAPAPAPSPERAAWSPVSSADAERAARVALEAVGGGTVNDVDRESEGGATWEVEITRTDGTQAEVHLDAEFRVLRTGDERDSNEGPDDGDESGGRDDDD